MLLGAESQEMLCLAGIEHVSSLSGDVTGKKDRSEIREGRGLDLHSCRVGGSELLRARKVFPQSKITRLGSGGGGGGGTHLYSPHSGAQTGGSL